MAFDAKKYGMKRTHILRDNRPFLTRTADIIRKPNNAFTTFIFSILAMWVYPPAFMFADAIFIVMLLYFWWLVKQDRTLTFKLPLGAKFKDKNNMGPGQKGDASGILYLGNTDKGDEMWFSNSDARTHILYLGTTGAGKTEGLKSMVSNAMAWGSGFVYIDGKADTDLWSSLSSLVRRFGRDDDLLVLNYMTGNSDGGSPSNTMNPFSSGSASYLTNMIVSLMPESEGDNAMWKERAVSLASAMMPGLTYLRDKYDIPLSVRVIRDYLSLTNVIKLQRDERIPAKIREGLKGYLDTLPGFMHEAYDEKGQLKPPGPDTPQYNPETAGQQHGYLAMQFTRSLQSLGDDYGYIFDTQSADIDMVDVVLNRRILVVLIPALEKSGDEIANLGKIIAATLKGMMGSTLGSTVEGTSATVIENKPTNSATPFMTVFDEVGYYTAQGMAVMAAQARSLGFSLIFSGQDLPAMKKRVREEANSITANCNIKIFGKLEDPTETKEFFEKTIGDEIVIEASSFENKGGMSKSYFDTKSAGIQHRSVISYDEIRTFKEGEAAVCFGPGKVKANIFYSNPGHANAMRVTRFVSLPPPDDDMIKNAQQIAELRDLMVNKSWTAKRGAVDSKTPIELETLFKGYKKAEKKDANPMDASIYAFMEVHGLENDLTEKTPQPATTKPQTTDTAVKSPLANLATTKDTTETTTTPKTETKTNTNTDSKNPMGFFSSSEKSDTAEKPKPAEKPAIESTVQATPPSVKKPEATPATQPKKLPKEIADIIENAGKKAHKAIFKNTSKDSDNIGTAE